MSDPVKNEWQLRCPYCGVQVALDATQIRWRSGVDGLVNVDAEFVAFHRCNG